MKARGVSCGEGSADLLAGFRGELTPPGAEDLRSHLAACPVCTEEDAGMRALAAALDLLPTLEPSGDSWSRMRRMIEADVPPVRPVRRSLRGVLPMVFAAGLAAAALLLAFLVPSSPAATLRPHAGDISVNGERLAGPRPADDAGMDLAPGTVIAAATLSRLSLGASREMDLTLAAGTRLVVGDRETLRLERGRILARVGQGPDPVAFQAAGGTVIVTGTVFDLFVGGDGAYPGVATPAGGAAMTATVTVIEGEVEVRAGEKPARVIHGMSYTWPEGGKAPNPVPADPWRARDWCRAPTPGLSLSGGLLRLTLTNETVSPLSLKPFDPASASYYLRLDRKSVETDRHPMDLKVQEGMVVEGGRRSDEPEILTLAPGDSIHLTIDLGRIDLRALGVPAGSYAVRVLYRPYPPLPADAWRGRLEAGPVTLRVD